MGSPPSQCPRCPWESLDGPRIQRRRCGPKAWNRNKIAAGVSLCFIYIFCGFAYAEVSLLQQGVPELTITSGGVLAPLCVAARRCGAVRRRVTRCPIERPRMIMMRMTYS